MHVVVVGAGVMGVTTAYYLQKMGCQVTVVEQHNEAAMECSHANGSFYSAGLSAPWAAPGAIGMAMRSLLDAQAAFKFRPDFTWRQARWICQTMRECHPARFARNRVRLTRLALYARTCLDEIEAAEGIAYDRRAGGVMQLYRHPVIEALIQGHVRHLQAMGIRHQFLSPGEVLALEPALATSSPQLFGALYLHDDSSGDCDRFTRALAQRVAAAGGRFLWNTPIERIQTEATGRGLDRVRSLAVRDADLQADAYVFAAGSFSAALLGGTVDVPVYPIKGYSMTATVTNPERAPRHSIFDFSDKMGMARFENSVRVSGIAEVVGHDRRLTPARCAQLARQFEAIFPEAADTRHATFWAGLRPATPDGVPIISRTRCENLYLNTGHGGSGWSLSCGSGKLVADLVLGHKPELDADDYRLAP